MKTKMKLLCVLTVCAAALSGCISKDKYKEDPTDVGARYIYTPAASQNVVALEPANVAFRLFLLTAMAEEQPVTDLELVTVQWGEPATEKKLKPILFGDQTAITYDAVAMVYTIEYLGYYNQYDKYKAGKVYVNTGGLRLDDGSASWSVYTETTGTSAFRTSTSTRNESATPACYVGVSSGSYTITNMAPNVWSIIGSGVKANYPNYEAGSWSLYYTFTATLDGAATDIYHKFSKGPYTIDGYGQGNSYLMGNDYDFVYRNMTPMKYVTECGPLPAEIDGKVECTISGPALDVLPSAKVEIEFTEVGTCTRDLIVRYNGLTNQD